MEINELGELFFSTSAFFIQLKVIESLPPLKTENIFATETSISIANDVATIFAHVEYIIHDLLLLLLLKFSSCFNSKVRNASEIFREPADIVLRFPRAGRLLSIEAGFYQKRLALL